MTALRPGEGPDVVALLTLKHRQIETLLLEAEQGADAEQRGWALKKAADELMLHMAVEQAVFYPAVCRWAMEALPQSVDVIDDFTHAGVHAALEAVRQLAPAEAGFAPACARLRGAVLSHHRAEEAGVFRQLARSMTPVHREALGHHVARSDAALRVADRPRSVTAGASVGSGAG